MSQSTAKRVCIKGRPNEKQKEFFRSRALYTAYGGARGGGKSWALRRKLVGLCLRYGGIRCLLIRRSMGELKSNHLLPFLAEYGSLISYRESEKCLHFPNGSTIKLGYCACDKDCLRYQGQEYDVIAIDEATQLSEYQFSIFKACLRGVTDAPKRMYLTCNPGGIGHAWVKRLFVDRNFREGEDPKDYRFISAKVYDNPVLLEADPDYVGRLESLSPKLRDAWLLGKWDVFEGQFFPEFSLDLHTVDGEKIPPRVRYFAAADYGFDMLAVLLFAVDESGDLFVVNERCVPDLTLREAGGVIGELCRGYPVEYLTASPDLWNRRQDTGRSGFEIMQSVSGVPPMTPADNRRIPGWRILREYLNQKSDTPRLYISKSCKTLIASLPALLCDPSRPEDASDHPHAVTHAPEALRYGVMSRCAPREEREEKDRNFQFPSAGKCNLFS